MARMTIQEQKEECQEAIHPKISRICRIRCHDLQTRRLSKLRMLALALICRLILFQVVSPYRVSLRRRFTLSSALTKRYTIPSTSIPQLPPAIGLSRLHLLGCSAPPLLWQVGAALTEWY